MKNISKTIIITLITLVMLASAYPLLGCCEGGCGSCCGGCCGGEDDMSEDGDDDGSDQYERVPTNLGNTQQAQVQNQRTPSVCDSITSNSISATASKAASGSGYTYSYSFTIRACANNVGYSVVLDGTAPNRIDSGVAAKGKEVTRSNSYTSSSTFTQLCINTGDNSLGNNGNYCVQFT